MSTELSTSGRTSFWQRPEGTAGKIIVGAAVLGAVALFVHFLPALILIAENVIQLAMLAGVILALFMLVTADRPRTLLFYLLQMVSRWVTSNFVDIDPVAILKAFARQMRKKRDDVQASIARILGVSRTLEGEVKRSEKELKDALRLADAAEKQGDEDALNTQAEKAGRRDANIREYKEMHAVVQEILDALNRVKRRVDYHIANSEDEMNELIRKNEVALAAREATSSASAVLGDSDLLEVRNMAADRIRERYTTALGELDGLIYMSRDLDKEIDLNQLAFRSDGRKKLDELRKKLSQVESSAPAHTARTQGLLATPAPDVVLPSAADENAWAERIRKPHA
jgi:Skp family chaperone for outer membrane proteins